jgi:hypothetical protein
MSDEKVVGLPPLAHDQRLDSRLPLRLSCTSTTDGTKISAPQNPRIPASGAVCVTAAKPPKPNAPAIPVTLAITGHQ